MPSIPTTSAGGRRGGCDCVMNQGGDAAIRLVLMQLSQKLRLLEEGGRDSGPHSAFDHLRAIPWAVKWVKLVTDISVFSPLHLHAAITPASPICCVTSLLSAISPIFHLHKQATSMALIPPTVSQLHYWGVSSHVAADWPAPRLSKTGLGGLKQLLKPQRSKMLCVPVLFPTTSFYSTCGKL